jgi:hypothetical protein
MLKLKFAALLVAVRGASWWQCGAHPFPNCWPMGAETKEQVKPNQI